MKRGSAQSLRLLIQTGKESENQPPSSRVLSVVAAARIRQPQVGKNVLRWEAGAVNQVGVGCHYPTVIRPSVIDDASNHLEPQAVRSSPAPAVLQCAEGFDRVKICALSLKDLICLSSFSDLVSRS